MNPKVDAYLSEASQWREEIQELRAIALAAGLVEELKWGQPCYTHGKSNVVILQGFKEACAILFCKGALLKDPKSLLEKPGENTQAARRIRFTSVKEIAKQAATLKAYLREAIAAEDAGLEVEFKTEPEPIPDELSEKWRQDPAFKKAFHALTPGRQRAYLLHFAAAKQSATRTARIEKYLPKILQGQGLNDR